MKVSCNIDKSRLALEFENGENDSRIIYIKGFYGTETFTVKSHDFYERSDMSEQEKEAALKEIEAFNEKNPYQIILMDD